MSRFKLAAMANGKATTDRFVQLMLIFDPAQRLTIFLRVAGIKHALSTNHIPLAVSLTPVVA
jgi:hypothetical protein